MRYLRWVAVMVLAIILYGQVRALESTSHAAPAFVPSAIHPGDPVPDLRLVPVGSLLQTDAEASLTALTQHGCRILVVFDSACPACERDAVYWSGVDSISIGGVPAPVTWIGLTQDTGASAFLKDFDLAAGYAAASIHELGRLGVRGTPTVVLTRARRFVEFLPRLPVDIAQLHHDCRVP
jgi:hypothetical protein